MVSNSRPKNSPGHADHLVAELLLPAGEEVVQRAERRLGARQTICFRPGARVALTPEQLGARVHDPVLGALAFLGGHLVSCRFAEMIRYSLERSI